MQLIPIPVLNDRYNEHYAMAADFVDGVYGRFGTSLRLNPNSLYIAIKSAYDDIERYKLYHQNNPHDDKSNSVKRAAYLSKWIMKCRPVEYVTPVADPKDITALLVNAYLCIIFMRYHIEAEVGKDFVVTEDKECEIVYDLTYREITGDGLLSIVQQIFDLVSGTKIVQVLSS